MTMRCIAFELGGCHTDCTDGSGVQYAGMFHADSALVYLCRIDRQMYLTEPGAPSMLRNGASGEADQKREPPQISDLFQNSI